MALTLCVLLWAQPGREEQLVEYEDAVLSLLAEHGGSVHSRYRNTELNQSPTEVQVIEFPDDAALQSFMADPARQRLAQARDESIARTEILRVAPVAL